MFCQLLDKIFEVIIVYIIYHISCQNVKLKKNSGQKPLCLNSNGNPLRFRKLPHQWINAFIPVLWRIDDLKIFSQLINFGLPVLV